MYLRYICRYIHKVWWWCKITLVLISHLLIAELVIVYLVINNADVTQNYFSCINTQREEIKIHSVLLKKIISCVTTAYRRDWMSCTSVYTTFTCKDQWRNTSSRDLTTDEEPNVGHLWTHPCKASWESKQTTNDDQKQTPVMKIKHSAAHSFKVLETCFP